MTITYNEIETKVAQRALVDNQGGGTLVPFIRAYVYDDCGDLEATNDTDFDGNPYVVVGTAEESSKKIDFVDELKENDRLKIDVIGSLNLATTAACVYMNQTTDQVGITSVGDVLEMTNVGINTNPAAVDVTSTIGEILFLINGNYELELQFTGDTQDGARRTSKVVLQVFNGVTWEDAPGSPESFGYHRNNASGESTTYNRVIVSAASNSRYRYEVSSLNGTIKTVSKGTSLVIKQI